MRTSPLMRRFVALLVITGSFLGLMINAEPAHALCVWPMEDGHWTNVDSSTRSITKVGIEFVCRDVRTPGEPPQPSYYINLFGSCHPTDCDWGVAGGNRDSSGWIRTTIDHGYATRHVWVQGYDYSGVNWLRVYIWTDFHDGREDYASDEWFLRS